MSKTDTILLGFEVGGGEPVRIPLGHMVVFGQSQAAGKTTALEAILTRAGVRAVAFRTKRGEGGFGNAKPLPPFLQERTDWRFVQSILEAELQSKQDFKQRWIMEACEGASTLAEVQANPRRLLAAAKSGMAKDMYYVLDHYFQLVVPRIAKLPKSDKLAIGGGLHVMDLEAYSDTPELQALVIRSVISWVHRRERGVAVVVPEAWRFLPAGRNSPVKMAAEELIREGAALRNFMLFDSQDMVGLDTLARRAAKVWLIGVQREINEVDRAVNSIPKGFGRPEAAEVATLKLGQFFACWEGNTHKTYVLPAWLPEDVGRAVARGEINAPPPPPDNPAKACKSIPDGPTIPTLTIQEDPMSAETDKKLEQLVQQQSQLLALLTQQAQPPKPADVALVESEPPRVTPPPPAAALVTFQADEESRYQQFKARLLSEAPALLKVLADGPELRVEVTRKTVTAEGSSILGRVAQLVARGWYAETKTFTATRAELRRTGPDVNNNSLSGALKQLVAGGFLTKEGSDGYKAAPGAKAYIVET